MKPSLLMVGSSGHASTVIEVLELRDEYRIVGLLDDLCEKGSNRHGYAILGTADDVVVVARDLNCTSFFVGIGDNWQRWRVANKILESIPAAEFAQAIDPSVFISKWASVGPGTFLMRGVIVSANARIGQGCIVNTASTVNHDCCMADYSSLSGGVHMGGGSSLGFRSSMGVASTIREKRHVGNDTVVGAGAVVLHDMPAETVVYGVPARVQRRRSPNERYML